MAQATNNAPPAVPPAPAAVDTHITMGGQTFDLHGMSVADGLRLYGVLPPEAKQEADTIATLAHNFRSAYDITFPSNVTWTNAVSQYIGFLQNNHGGIPESAPAYIKQMDTQLRPTLQNMPGFKQFYAVSDTADNVGGAWNGFEGVLMALPRMAGATMSTVGELSHLVGPSISADQARAFGAAFAAATYDHGAARRAEPLIAWPKFLGGQPSQVFSNPSTYVSALFDWLGLHIPFVKPLLAELTQWLIPNILHLIDPSKPAPAWNDVWNAAQQEVDNRNAHEDTSITGLANSRLRDSDRRAASVQMQAARTVADLNTDQLAALIANGGTYLGADGALYNVNINGGRIDNRKALDGAGHPITPASRIGGIWSHVVSPWTGMFHDAANGHWTGGDTATALGTGIGGYAAYRIAPTAARVTGTVLSGTARGTAEATTGFTRGVIEGNARLVGGGAWGRAQAAQALVDRLTQQQAALQTEHAAAEAEVAAAQNGSWWARTHAQGHLNQVTAKIAKNEGELMGRSGLFGRHIAGAHERLAQANTALQQAEETSGLRGNVARNRIGAADELAGRGTAKSSATVADHAEGALSRFFNGALARVGIHLNGKAAEQGAEGTATVVETLANGSRVARVARLGGKLVGRAATPLLVAYEGGSGIYDAATGDTRGAVTHGSTLAVMGTGAAVGAGIGACFFGVGAIPGAALGATVAGVGDAVAGFFGVGSSDLAGKVYDHFSPPQATAPRQATQPQGVSTLSTDPGIQAAVADIRHQQTVFGTVRDMHGLTPEQLQQLGLLQPGNTSVVPQGPQLTHLAFV